MSYVFAVVSTKENWRSFYGCQKTKRTFGIKEGFIPGYRSRKWQWLYCAGIRTITLILFLKFHFAEGIIIHTVLFPVIIWKVCNPINWTWAWSHGSSTWSKKKIRSEHGRVRYLSFLICCFYVWTARNSYFVSDSLADFLCLKL